MSERGIIKIGLCGYYDVILDDGRTVSTVARGIFRKKHIKPLAGDMVLVEESQEEQGVYGVITDILPRKCAFVRPPVANVDRVLLFLSASTPKPDYMLADKLILQAVRAGAEPVICISKADTDMEEAQRIASVYRDFRCIITSAENGTGLDELKALLPGGITAVAGQSGAGKSTLLNTLYPGLQLETGVLSRKTDRGRHTTRASCLIPIDSGYVIDTPGFSLIETELLPPEDIKNSYPELKGITGCRFGEDCLHRGEPGCAMQPDAITQGRYERYLAILKEADEMWRSRYRGGTFTHSAVK